MNKKMKSGWKPHYERVSDEVKHNNSFLLILITIVLVFLGLVASTVGVDRQNQLMKIDELTHTIKLQEIKLEIAKNLVKTQNIVLKGLTEKQNKEK